MLIYYNTDANYFVLVYFIRMHYNCVILKILYIMYSKGIVDLNITVTFYIQDYIIP